MVVQVHWKRDNDLPPTHSERLLRYPAGRPNTESHRSILPALSTAKPTPPTLQYLAVMIGTIPYPNVVQFSFPNRRELTMTMCRPQEFYESSHHEIKGKHFDWEKFLEVFSDDNGRLDYFSFWSGFNFPGKVFETFLKVFENNLSRRERHLAKEVFLRVDRSRPYYVIATLPNSEDTIRHELAHALFCVNEEYRKKAEELVCELPLEVRDKIEIGLSGLGYSEDVHVDEIQAYLSTGSPEELKKRFALEVTSTTAETPKFRKLLGSVLGNHLPQPTNLSPETSTP